MIVGQVHGQSLRVVHPTMVSDTIDYLEAEFLFVTEDWQDLVKWVHFKKGDVVYDIKLTDGKVRKEDHLNLDAGIWELYLHGNAVVNGKVVTRITTVCQKISVQKSGVLEGQPLPEVPATAAEQILGAAEEALSVANGVRADAENGLFDGEKGERGEPGAKGEKGDKGDKGDKGEKGDAGEVTLAYANSAFSNCLRNTMQGASVTFDDVAPDYRVLSVVSAVEPVQAEGTPSLDNVLPLGGHTNVKLTRCGKNLAKVLAFSANPSSINNANGYGTQLSCTENSVTVTQSQAPDTANPGEFANGYFCIHLDKPIKDGETVTFSCDVSITDNPLGVTQMPIYCNATQVGKCLDFTTSGKIIKTMAWQETRSGYSYDYIMIRISGCSGTFSNIQIEIGDVATDYEPYVGDAVTLDFGETVYGGTLDWNTGVLTIDRAVRALDGTEGWAVNHNIYDDVTSFSSAFYKLPESERPLQMPVATTSIHTGWLKCRCSHLPRSSTNPMTVPSVKQTTQWSAILVNVPVELTPNRTAEEFCAWLASEKQKGTPVQIYYLLKKPRTVQLTPKQIEALTGVNTVSATTGDVSVTYNRDINKAFAELQQAIISLGGNV